MARAPKAERPRDPGRPCTARSRGGVLLLHMGHGGRRGATRDGDGKNLTEVTLDMDTSASLTASASLAR